MSSAVALHEKHSEAVAAWEAQLSEMDSHIAGLQEELNDARMDALRRDPLKRPGGVGTEVGDLTRKLDAALTKRDGLARDLAASKLILEDLQEDANAEARERELREAEEAISDARASVAEKWAAFVSLAEQLRDAWPAVATAVTDLDALPAGEPCRVPFPADVQRAFTEALRPSEGEDAFATSPRIVARRLNTVRSSGVGPQDTTGYARTMQDTGAWR